MFIETAPCVADLHKPLNPVCSSASRSSACLFNWTMMMRIMSLSRCDEADDAIVFAQLEVAG
ncbi:hypothetical protein DPMN_065966 [Dreissena polymorpha]|uniref:Uncharacterized protein n=1 Tax=Dreissena polymorpha TaxID=45954 RepID=A0A9D4BUL9_DREPO|nr:hypothetical protein DPMN_065966 [Dreissena polymorpha]